MAHYEENQPEFYWYYDPEMEYTDKSSQSEDSGVLDVGQVKRDLMV